MKSFKELIENFIAEDSPVNSVGGGSIAGIGVGPDGEPGFRRAPLLRRKKRRKKFANYEVFVVNSKDYLNCLTAKNNSDRYSKFIHHEETAKKISEYAENNPGAPIIVEDESTGAMTYLKLGRDNLLSNMYGR
ncbi:MAG TPA: hypothetical protein EYO59_12990 [Chromatiaceae bacterium]|jgi:hypothetical protein|nr:hypothetical protein [Chromatiaceae bacterium]